MTQITFDCRLQGCLVGAAIGAELGFARLAHPQHFDIRQPADLLSLDLQPAGHYQPERKRLVGAKLAPFIDLGVRAYANKNGRVTPADFAALFKEDAGVAAPAFAFDGLHSTQELLKEGMPALISGYGAAPCGLIAACMPAVGIYHFADPEYAYLDGVELASVVQPRLGADWAALCAAAIAAALDPSADADAVVENTLRIAHANNKELYYELTAATRLPAWARADDEAFATWWYQVGGVVPRTKECMWVSYNPIRYVLPLLARLAKDPQQFMRLLIGTQLGFYMEGRVGGHTVSAIIGGAILGALYGPEVFPARWLEWAQPIAADWQQAMGRVVCTRQQEEVRVLAVMDQLTRTHQQGRTLLHDKIYGCILAGAIGNAMGSPVETQYYWEIDEKHPGGIKTVLDPKRLESEDDNQMAMFLVETYLDRDGLPVMARHFGKTWQEKLDRDYFFPLCMGNAYDLICKGWDPRIIGQWSQVTGSTVMCMEPAGLYHAADPEYARIDAIAISHMYQRGLDVAAAGMLAATVAEALRPEATVDSVLEAAVQAAPTEKLRTFDQRPFDSARQYILACLEIAAKYDDVLAARAELYEKCLFYHPIDPLELWGLALAMFKIAKGDVRQAAIGGTNIGRDSDTIAGRAAMLAGTLRGAGSVPAEWIAMFGEPALQRIDRNADALARLVAGPKAARMRRRQAAIVMA